LRLLLVAVLAIGLLQFCSLADIARLCGAGRSRPGFSEVFDNERITTSLIIRAREKNAAPGPSGRC